MNRSESGTYAAHKPSKTTRTSAPISHNTKRFGDDVQAVPCPLFTKARTIGDEHAVVLPLNYDRHFGPAFDQLIQEKDGFVDFPFLDKISKVKGLILTKRSTMKRKLGAGTACDFMEYIE